MDKFKIEGSKPLKGEVRVGGAKNEALKLIAFSVILNSPVKITNVPRISDVQRQCEIFRSLGGRCEFTKNEIKIDPQNIKSYDITTIEARKLRASLVFLGPLLSRFGKVILPRPGGCVIGARSIDTHTDAFVQLGAKISIIKNKLEVTLERPLRKVVNLLERSVTATENIAMYAAGIEDEITIKNCAIEPEIIALLEVIQASGASVKGIGTRELKIKGSKKLSIKSIETISDRIEAATFAIAFLATGGEGFIKPFPREYLGSFIKVLDRVGAKIKYEDGGARIMKSDDLKPFDITTSPYPGFPTDLQSPMALIAAKAKGVSTINEAMYENRLGYLRELKKMGLDVDIINDHVAKINGPSELNSTTIDSLDLRSGITLLIAGLITDGITTIRNAQIIDRGYEDIEGKLTRLGAKIERIK